MNDFEMLNNILNGENVEESVSKEDIPKICVFFYLLVNGVLTQKDIVSILEYYELNLTKKQLEEIYSGFQFKVSDKCVSFIELEDEFLEEILKAKEKLPLKFFSLNEMMSYMLTLYSNISLIANTLNVSVDDTAGVYLNIMIFPNEIDDALKYFKECYKVKKSNEKELKSLLLDSQEFIKYWIFNGRTSDEYYFDLVSRRMALDCVPKASDLRHCIESCNAETLESFENTYNCESLDDLVNCIIAAFKLEIYNCSKEYVDVMLKFHKNKVDDYLDANTVVRGFIYFYKEGEEIKGFVPDEIREIIDKEYDELDEEDFEHCDYVSADNLVYDYMNMNGVIRKKKLQKLLKENHEIKLSIKELDEIVVSQDSFVRKDVYMITNLEADEVDDLLAIKDRFGKYKIHELGLLDKEDEMLEELEDIVKEYGLESQLTSIIPPILFPIKYGVFSKEICDSQFEDLKINKKGLKNRLYDVAKKYKNDIPIWNYNGFTLNEVQSMNKKIAKVGRNDPCICGSGKKYKKCCGK